MNAPFYPPQRAYNNDANMIPMINIVFLLLIFFMLAGQIQGFQPENMRLPDALANTPAERQGMQVVINKDNAIFLDGSSVSLNELDARLQQFEGAATATPGVHADKRLTAAQLDEVLALFRGHEIAPLRLYTAMMEPE